MIEAQKTGDEAKRLEILRQYAILDTLPEPAVADLVILAAAICEAPVAMISLIGETRQYIKAKIGTNLEETSREVSFCGHTIQQRDVFIVPDTSLDERFRDNPLVSGDEAFRFYAGAPLISPEDTTLGALCVWDRVPRVLTATQTETLQVLARQVVTQFELHRRAHQLADSEERLRLVTDNARVGLVMVDKDRRYVYANSAYAKILGLLSAEIVGQRVQDILPEVYEEQIRPRLDRAFTGERISYEMRKPTPDSERYYTVKYEPALEDGLVTQVVVVITDITDRKQRETVALRLATIVEFSDDAIISKDTNGIVTSWNHGAEKIFGFSADEMVGHSIMAIIPPERAEEENQILSKIRAGQNVDHFETERRRKDGSLINVSATASPIKDSAGVVIGASKIARDITGQKLAEKARHATEEKIAEQADFLNKARDAILVSDLDGVILFWNKGAERIYGWKSEDVIGRKSSDILNLDPKKFDGANREVMEKGEWNGELRHGTLNRGNIVIEARWTLLRDGQGNPKSILAINTDITERKKIEAQFMRAQRMESIGTLAGGIAHDLNNILSPVLMSIEALRTFVNGDTRALNILNLIELSAQRGSDIVRQVLSFSRGVEGERAEIQPRHLLMDIENIMRNTFPKDIHLRVTVPKETWTIIGDATQIHQILLNLCVNARDAMPHGGSLTVNLENCVLDEHYAAMNIHARPGAYAVINVVDTGMGIEPANLEKIFEPFFTTKELTKGTGLGLSTVMAIVKSHSGFVNVYSEPGNGTTFKVYLPAKPDSAQSAGNEELVPSLPRGNGETILLVDDEASILTIASQTLQAFGYQVLEAHDGAEAVGVYAENRKQIDLVLTDMAMPLMDGVATIHALQRINPTLKIIGASGLDAHGVSAKVSAAGVHHFLTKPYTAATLLKAIRELLDEAK